MQIRHANKTVVLDIELGITVQQFWRLFLAARAGETESTQAKDRWKEFLLCDSHDDVQVGDWSESENGWFARLIKSKRSLSSAYGVFGAKEAQVESEQRDSMGTGQVEADRFGQGTDDAI